MNDVDLIHMDEIAINYEDAVEDAFINGLKQKFSTDDTRLLVRYLFTRCAVQHGVDSIKDATKFMDFVLQELCIHHIDIGNRKAIVFHCDGQEVGVVDGFSNQNSLFNIFYSIESQFLSEEFVNNQGDAVSAKTYIKSLVSDIQKCAKQKLKPYKDSRYSYELLTFFKLQILNERFCIKPPVEAPHLSMFNQRESRMSIDTLYERYLHAENFDTTNVHSITEAQVRDYLYFHLDMIEDGLKPIVKEFQTKEGRVDIVARDKDGNLVVIELKTENDKRLVWQCMYYPDEVKRKLGAYDNDKKIRMVTVAPEYPEFIKKPLDKLGYVERYVYTIKVFNNVIEELNVEKLQSDLTTDSNESKLDSSTSNRLDYLINSFVYVRGELSDNRDLDMDAKELNDVALELVKIAYLNNDASDDH